MIFAVPYWNNVYFNLDLFWIGFFGSIINVIGLVCLQNALSTGPAGPVSAITATACLYNVVIEAFINHKMLSYLESICLVLGFFGALILVIPNQFEKLLRIILCKPKPSDIEIATNLSIN